MEETISIWFVLTILASLLGGYSLGGPSRLKKMEWDMEAIDHFAKRHATKMECPHCNELVDLRANTSYQTNEAWLNKHKDNEDDEE